MKDNDYTFGQTFVFCDGKGCNNEETIDGFDGHPLPYSDVNDELRDMGWISKKVKGEWIDLCDECKDKPL